MNLDAKINEISYSLAQAIKRAKKDNELEKAFGVLSSDGVYAFYVFCKSKQWGPKGNQTDLWEKISGGIKSFSQFLPDYKGNLNQDYLVKISGNLTHLLFLKDILEKTLTYTRYHLKAMESENV